MNLSDAFTPEGGQHEVKFNKIASSPLCYIEIIRNGDDSEEFSGSLPDYRRWVAMHQDILKKAEAFNQVKVVAP